LRVSQVGQAQNSAAPLVEKALTALGAGVLPGRGHRGLAQELLDQEAAARPYNGLKEYAQFKPASFSLQEVNDRNSSVLPS